MRVLRTLPSFIVIGLSAACHDSLPPTSPNVPSEVAVAIDGRGPARRYIVRFRDDTPDPDALAGELSARVGARIIHRWNGVIKGMNVEMTDGAAALLRTLPGVAYVDDDKPVYAYDTQVSPPWGLDRIDQRNLPLNDTYDYSNDGTGVTGYVLDTGLNPSHVEFGTRASIGFDATGGDGYDCHGHGTHVAGTLGGITYGVAKNLRIVGVKVLRCGTDSFAGEVITGINWVTSNATRPAIVNMSLGGPKDITMNDAVNGSVASGITYIVAAGNCRTNDLGQCVEGPYNACTRSPASATAAITVGATSSTDGFAYFSNFGSCVKINAPGVDIRSAWIGPNNAESLSSGTSMASPHVAGAAARYLGTFPTVMPSEVKSALLQKATSGVISGIHSGTPNLLLYTRNLDVRLLAASIFGPSAVSPFRDCNWSASVSGGRSPYSFSWSVNTWNSGGQPTGQWVPPVGSAQNFTSRYYSSSSFSTGFVYLTVRDADGSSVQSTQGLTYYSSGGC